MSAATVARSAPSYGLALRVAFGLTQSYTLGLRSLPPSSRTTLTHNKTLMSPHHSGTHFSEHRRTVRSVLGAPLTPAILANYGLPYPKQKLEYYITTPVSIPAATLVRSAPSYRLASRAALGRTQS